MLACCHCDTVCSHCDKVAAKQVRSAASMCDTHLKGCVRALGNTLVWHCI
jgi:hypothetical protein